MNTENTCTVCLQPGADIVHTRTNPHGFTWNFCHACFFRCDVCGQTAPIDAAARANHLDAHGGLVSFGTNGAKWRACEKCRADYQAQQERDADGALCIISPPKRIDVESLKGA